MKSGMQAARRTDDSMMQSLRHGDRDVALEVEFALALAKGSVGLCIYDSEGTARERSDLLALVTDLLHQEIESRSGVEIVAALIGDPK